MREQQICAGAIRFTMCSFVDNAMLMTYIRFKDTRNEVFSVILHVYSYLPNTHVNKKRLSKLLAERSSIHMRLLHITMTKNDAGTDV